MRSDSELPAGQERITWVKGSYRSRYGLIVSEWKRIESGFLFECETPVSAKFYLPILPDKNNFTLNGKQMNTAEFNIIDGCYVIDLESGKHAIEY